MTNAAIWQRYTPMARNIAKVRCRSVTPMLREEKTMNVAASNTNERPSTPFAKLPEMVTVTNAAITATISPIAVRCARLMIRATPVRSRTRLEIAHAISGATT